eukprot:GILK01004981.1.p1 GENE.GILK01004981.1~~GILK01004981.1.p1  ORF type:complete len:213 (-),score=51.38 GILK01004981.1:105-701(-)
MSTKGGRLVFKGESEKPKKHKKEKKEKKEKKHKKNKRSRDSTEETAADEGIKQGTGRIITSGTTLHGVETEFLRELEVGDAVMVTHPSTLQLEAKVITMVLSNKSAAISSPFSSDLITGISFQYQKKKTENTEQEANKEEEEKRLNKKLKTDATTLQYREKTGMWGYKTVTQHMDKDITREQLLDMRVKKGRDKFCWM